MSEHDRFDAALRQAARAIVTEELPHGVLDPAVGQSLDGGSLDGSVRARRTIPGFAAAAAVVVLALATALALAPRSPGGPPAAASPSPSPVATPGALRTTSQIREDLATLDYTCEPGQPLSSIGPEPEAAVREATVCTAPAGIGPFMAAVIVGESASGHVVDVHAKADIVGGDTAAARGGVADALAKVAAIGATPASSGNALGDWVVATAPTLEPTGGANAAIDGFDIKLARNANGGYVLIVHPVR